MTDDIMVSLTDITRNDNRIRPQGRARKDKEKKGGSEEKDRQEEGGQPHERPEWKQKVTKG